MNRIESSIIRSRELKENGIELSGTQISKDILVKSDNLIELKDSKRNIVEDIAVESSELKNALQSEKTIDVVTPDFHTDIQYANYENILNHYTDNSKPNYVKINSEDSSIVTLDITNALIIEADNVLLDEPLVIKDKNKDELIKIKEKIESADNIHLYSENERLKIELQQHKTYTFKEAFEGEIANIIVCGLFISLFIPFSIWTTIFSTVFCIALLSDDIMKLFKGKTFRKRYFVNYGLDNNCRIDNVVDIEPDKSYKVDLSCERTNIVMKCDEIDAEWNIENKGVFPDTFVELFENIGFENINNESVTLKINPTYKTSNVENCLISECGIWCINPEQSIHQNDVELEKVIQYN